MNFRIENLSQKKLVVLTQRMSILNNKTVFLWNSFMKRKAEIQDRIGSNLFSKEMLLNLNYKQSLEAFQNLIEVVEKTRN